MRRPRPLIRLPFQTRVRLSTIVLLAAFFAVWALYLRVHPAPVPKPVLVPYVPAPTITAPPATVRRRPAVTTTTTTRVAPPPSTAPTTTTTTAVGATTPSAPVGSTTTSTSPATSTSSSVP